MLTNDEQESSPEKAAKINSKFSNSSQVLLDSASKLMCTIKENLNPTVFSSEKINLNHTPGKPVITTSTLQYRHLKSAGRIHRCNYEK